MQFLPSCTETCRSPCRVCIHDLAYGCCKQKSLGFDCNVVMLTNFENLRDILISNIYVFIYVDAHICT